jgi:hypothetical protein
MQPKQILGLIGGFLLILASFMPVLSAPLVGSVTLFNNGKGDGVLLLIAGMLALVIALARGYMGLLVPAIGAAIIGLVDFSNVLGRMHDLQVQASGNIFAQAITNGVQLQYGWIVLLAAVVLLFIAPFVGSSTQSGDEWGETRLSRFEREERQRLIQANKEESGLASTQGGWLSRPRQVEKARHVDYTPPSWAREDTADSPAPKWPPLGDGFDEPREKSGFTDAQRSYAQDEKAEHARSPLSSWAQSDNEPGKGAQMMEERFRATKTKGEGDNELSE